MSLPSLDANLYLLQCLCILHKLPRGFPVRLFLVVVCLVILKVWTKGIGPGWPSERGEVFFFHVKLQGVCVLQEVVRRGKGKR